MLNTDHWDVKQGYIRDFYTGQGSQSSLDFYAADSRTAAGAYAVRP